MNKQVMTDEAQMVAHLMNELAEAQLKLNRAKAAENDEICRLNNENKMLRKENNVFRQDQCEWVCLMCHNEYYGPAAVEKGTFKCLTCKPESFCVPKKFLARDDADTVLAELQKKAS